MKVHPSGSGLTSCNRKEGRSHYEGPTTARQAFSFL
jgi:hypothetical protein